MAALIHFGQNTENEVFFQNFQNGISLKCHSLPKNIKLLIVIINHYILGTCLQYTQCFKMYMCLYGYFSHCHKKVPDRSDLREEGFLVAWSWWA